jgi:hypothetical protein
MQRGRRQWRVPSRPAASARWAATTASPRPPASPAAASALVRVMRWSSRAVLFFCINLRNLCIRWTAPCHNHVAPLHMHHSHRLVGRVRRPLRRAVRAVPAGPVPERWDLRRRRRAREAQLPLPRRLGRPHCPGHRGAVERPPRFRSESVLYGAFCVGARAASPAKTAVFRHGAVR